MHSHLLAYAQLNLSTFIPVQNTLPREGSCPFRDASSYINELRTISHRCAHRPTQCRSSIIEGSLPRKLQVVLNKQHQPSKLRYSRTRSCLVVAQAYNGIPSVLSHSCAGSLEDNAFLSSLSNAPRHISNSIATFLEEPSTSQSFHYMQNYLAHPLTSCTCSLPHGSCQAAWESSIICLAHLSFLHQRP